MATVRWHGNAFEAEPISQFDNGDWLMEAREHGARFTIGSHIRVKQSEIIGDIKPAVPVNAATSQAKLEKSMADERAAIPPVQEILAKANTQEFKAAYEKAKDTKDMSKLSELAGLVANTNKEVDAIADDLTARVNTAKTKINQGVGKLGAVVTDMEKGAVAIEDLANQLSNGGPPLA